VHAPGGLALAALQIAHAIRAHPAKVTCTCRTTPFRRHLARAGADEIIMDDHAVLGPVDPQVGAYPAASVLATVARKSVDELEDQTLILADLAEKAIAQVKGAVKTLLAITCRKPRPSTLPPCSAPALGRTTIRSHPRWRACWPAGESRSRSRSVCVDASLPAAGAPAGGGGIPAAAAYRDVIARPDSEPQPPAMRKLFEDVAQNFYDVLTHEQELNNLVQEGMDVAVV